MLEVFLLAPEEFSSNFIFLSIRAASEKLLKFYYELQATLPGFLFASAFVRTIIIHNLCKRILMRLLLGFTNSGSAISNENRGGEIKVEFGLPKVS